MICDSYLVPIYHQGYAASFELIRVYTSGFLGTPHFLYDQLKHPKSLYTPSLVLHISGDPGDTTCVVINRRWKSNIWGTVEQGGGISDSNLILNCELEIIYNMISMPKKFRNIIIIIIWDSGDIKEKCLEDYNPLHNPIH